MTVRYLAKGYFFGVWGFARNIMFQCIKMYRDRYKVNLQESGKYLFSNRFVCFKIMFEKHDELFGMFSIIFKIQILDSLIQVTLMERENLSPSLTILKLMVMIILFCPLTINLLI